ncbi:MAG: ABC transporter ATP-binding protein [Opitutales bacterium]|nr:ABC transporter ATP-binding protein [Opitutales bacterium]
MSSEILRIEALKKSFASPSGGEIEVLRGADLSLKEGESASLRGESGAGKTTFLNIAACLENPTSGAVFWDGKRVDALSNCAQTKLRAAYMGFVFQSYCLVPELNALENVLLAARIANKFGKPAAARAREILERVGLKDRMAHMPSQMSGGERQRVAIARAILNRPKVIFADEPTGNLDENTGLEVMDMLLGLCKNENTALLLITHNPDFARRTSRSLVLKAGKILEG